MLAWIRKGIVWAGSGKKHKKRARPEGGALFCYRNNRLQSDDVLSLRTFLTLSHGELNLLAFGQGLEAGALDGAEMCEHIRTTFLLDETKTFSFVEPLNGAFYCRHNTILNNNEISPRWRM